MDYRLITDWTHPGWSLDFLIPIPFLVLGMFLLVKGRRADPAKVFMFGSALINGSIVTIISLVAFAYALNKTMENYESKFEFLNLNQIAINGSISNLDESEAAYHTFIEISGKKYLLYKPIPKFRFDGQPQLEVHKEAKILFVRSDSGNVIVKLEVKNMEVSQ